MEPSAEQPRKLPEFIILDDDYWKAKIKSKIPQEEPPSVGISTFKLKITCLLFAFLALIWTTIGLICYPFFALLHLVTGFRFKTLRRILDLYWVWIKFGAAVSLGFFVALFSLFLGMAIILAYLARMGDTFQQAVFAKNLYPHIKDIMKTN